MVGGSSEGAEYGKMPIAEQQQANVAVEQQETLSASP
jgi:hypothetical protein